MEKEKRSNGKTVVIIILAFLLLGAISYIGYDILFVREESSINKQGTNKNSRSTEEKELDINSRLVQTLYRKVTADYKEDWIAFWRYTKYGNQYDYNKEIEKIDMNSASEEMKMNLVSQNLKENEKKYLDCTTYQIPPQDSEGRSSVCKYNQGQYDNTYHNAYTKSYIELVYQDLYGKDSKLDTSVPLYIDPYGIEKYVYIDNLDMYVLYPEYLEGTSGQSAGGYTTNISKAIENDGIVKIYQDVIKTEYKEVNGIIDENNESSKITSNYTLVYTFKLDSDGMYNFVSIESFGGKS